MVVMSTLPRTMERMVATSGTGWRLAPCLVELFAEADERDPTRDRTSDGSIGNAEHAARLSDHNPDDGWVCAADIDDDDDETNPGVDLLRAHLVAIKDPRVKYLIRNGTIWKAYENRGLPAWTPQVYTGLNAHKSHLHISVWNTDDARNDLRPWWPQPEAPASHQEEDETMFIGKAPGHPTRFIDSPLAVPIGTDTVKALTRVGVKTLSFTEGEMDKIINQVGRVLDDADVVAAIQAET